MNKPNVIVDKLNELYKIYEEYCWRHDELEIVVIFDDNTITLYLNNQIDNMDTFCLSFNKREKKIYKYVSLKFFNLLLGDVYIYNDDDTFYNKKHKPYLMVIINDEDILKNVNYLVVNQGVTYIMNGVNDICKKEPFKAYSKKFMNEFDERIGLSKKKLWSCEK